ncbi:MAG: B12-binding domain-containing radical SAM protein [Saccharofermentans sp.]|nr:B12-binding domain-containing radical SAM protein [Saccharofermentans sp.]
MNVFLMYPCGDMFQRGEDRCQSNIKSSTSTSMRACNDLGYMAAILRDNHSVFLRDYQTEGASFDELCEDVCKFMPEMVVVSTTNATVFNDMDQIASLKEKTGLSFTVVFKGAIFFDAEKDLISQLDKGVVDIFVGGEIDWVIKDIVEKEDLHSVPGIIIKEGDTWVKTKCDCWNVDLDAIPFPARDLMNNALYTRPDTGEPMATIQTARGCPSNCIYCLTPTISGKAVRTRSPENVFAEIQECYDTYGIKNFFFKADTFTINKNWVLSLCNMIKNSNLDGKIAYTVNSRVKPISEEVLVALKETGCFTIAYGIESGSDETMKLIKKGATVEDARNAIALTKKVGIPIFGFFMIGFPWETEAHIKETEKLIFELDCDFMELHIALPYYGSRFYEMCKSEGVLSGEELGTDYFHAGTTGTKYVPMKRLLGIRKRILLKYHCRPSYIFHKMKACHFSPKIIGNYVKFGLRLVKNALAKG